MLFECGNECFRELAIGDERDTETRHSKDNGLSVYRDGLDPSDVPSHVFGIVHDDQSAADLKIYLVPALGQRLASEHF